MNPILWIWRLPSHMAEAVRSLRTAGTMERGRRLCMGFLLCLSAFATMFGFADILEGGSEKAEFGMLAASIALAAIVVGVMWLMLEWALDRSRQRGPRIVYGVAYVFFMLWSLSFGYGFYWKMFAASDHARLEFAQVVDRTNSSLGDARRGLGVVSEQLKGIRATAQSRIALESKTGSGGSCINLPTPGGDGPVWQTRQVIDDRVRRLANNLDANLDASPTASVGAPAAASLPGAQQLSQGPAAAPAPAPAPTSAPAPPSHADLLIAQIDDTTKKLGSLVKDDHASSQSELDATFRSALYDAQALIGKVNTGLEGAKRSATDLRSFATTLETGFVGRVSCQDTELAQQLNDAAKALDGITPVTTISTEEQTPNLGARATRDAFFKVWDLILDPIFAPLEKAEAAEAAARLETERRRSPTAAAVEEKPAPPKRKFSRQDLIAGVAAVAVDIGIFVTAFAGRERPPLQGLEPVLRRYVRSPRLRRALNDLVRMGGDDLRLLIERSSVGFAGGHYLFAAAELPAYATPMLNILAALAEAGEGRYVHAIADLGAWPRRVFGGCLGPSARARLETHLRRRISASFEQLAVETAMGRRMRRMLPPQDIDLDDATLMVVTPGVWTALQLTIDAIRRGEGRPDPDATAEDAASAPNPGGPEPAARGPGGEGVRPEAERPRARGARRRRSSRPQTPPTNDAPPPQPAPPLPGPFATDAAPTSGAAPRDPPPSPGGLDFGIQAEPGRRGGDTLPDEGRPTMPDAPPPGSRTTILDPESDD